jgi:hypothetical protein
VRGHTLLEADRQPTTLVSAALQLASVFPNRAGAIVLDFGPAAPPLTSPLSVRYAVRRGPCYVAVATLLSSRLQLDGIILVAEGGAR